mgnify:CR=1 FL=1
MKIDLAPLQSLLLVFEPGENHTSADSSLAVELGSAVQLDSSWKVSIYHVNGDTLEYHFNYLVNLTQSGMPALESFAGKAVYETTIDSAQGSILMVGGVNKGLTEVHVNGEKIGCRGYGEHRYDLSQALKPGKNKLEIVYVSVLANYCSGLQDNSTARRWTDYGPVALGITGPVTLK